MFVFIISKEFGKLVRQKRKQLNFSQRDLALKCNIDHTLISKIENNNASITFKAAYKIMIALNFEKIEIQKFCPTINEKNYLD